MCLKSCAVTSNNLIVFAFYSQLLCFSLCDVQFPIVHWLSSIFYYPFKQKQNNKWPDPNIQAPVRTSKSTMDSPDRVMNLKKGSLDGLIPFADGERASISSCFVLSETDPNSRSKKIAEGDFHRNVDQSAKPISPRRLMEVKTGTQVSRQNSWRPVANLSNLPTLSSTLVKKNEKTIKQEVTPGRTNL